MSVDGAPRLGSRSYAGRTLVWTIRAYQAARAGHVSPCRFTPTCSHYAVEAVETHGPRRGVSLAVRRLLRCRPGGPSGFDPVPPATAGPGGTPRRSPPMPDSPTPDSPTGAT